MAKQLLDCGDWHAFFSWLLPQASGISLLHGVDEAGHPVEEGFLKWLREERHWSQRPTGRKVVEYWLAHQHDVRTAKKVLKWLRSHKRPLRFCRPLLRVYPHASSRIQRHVARYAAAVACPSWSDLVASALSHPNPHNRVQACRLLAHFGEARYIRRMKHLATTDVASVQRDALLTFPVRRACRVALMALKKRP